MKYPWRNILYFDSNGKTIPYRSPQQNNSKGGFINLKRNSGAIHNIHEATSNPDLLLTLRQINKPESAVFSVGCQLESISEKDLHGITGYIEFAINDQSLVIDSTSYFSLFIQFQNQLATGAFPHDVQFDWVVIPALFTEIGIHGFTCAIKVNTACCSSVEQCKAAWSGAISVIGSFLASVAINGSREIYQALPLRNT
jgi:hypothetical protein